MRWSSWMTYIGNVVQEEITTIPLKIFVLFSSKVPAKLVSKNKIFLKVCFRFFLSIRHKFQREDLSLNFFICELHYQMIQIDQNYLSILILRWKFVSLSWLMPWLICFKWVKSGDWNRYVWNFWKIILLLLYLLFRWVHFCIYIDIKISLI
jgi:hypothetical protein